MSKKFILGGLIAASVLTTLVYYGHNQKLKGIIKNQNHTIDGLLREVKKMSYHLGKKKF